MAPRQRRPDRASKTGASKKRPSRHDRERPHPTGAHHEARDIRRSRRAVSHAGAAVAVYLAAQPARPAAPRGVGDRASVRGQACDHGRAVHVQMGGRCALRAGQRADRARFLAGLGDRRADCDDHRLRRHAHPDGRADAVARRGVRQGCDARGAPARDPHLRAHARIVAALSSRAQDRRPHARAGARAQRHRDHRADGHPAIAADRRRGGADRGRPVLHVRLALRARDPGHRRALHVVHVSGDRMAHRHPPPHERQRQRRQHQGDRTRCSTTRR